MLQYSKNQMVSEVKIAVRLHNWYITRHYVLWEVHDYCYSYVSTGAHCLYCVLFVKEDKTG